MQCVCALIKGEMWTHIQTHKRKTLCRHTAPGDEREDWAGASAAKEAQTPLEAQGLVDSWF